jgi:hypothetical protein
VQCLAFPIDAYSEIRVNDSTNLLLPKLIREQNIRAVCGSYASTVSIAIPYPNLFDDQDPVCAV